MDFLLREVRMSKPFPFRKLSQGGSITRIPSQNCRYYNAQARQPRAMPTKIRRKQRTPGYKAQERILNKARAKWDAFPSWSPPQIQFLPFYYVISGFKTSFENKKSHADACNTSLTPPLQPSISLIIEELHHRFHRRKYFLRWDPLPKINYGSTGRLTGNGSFPITNPGWHAVPRCGWNVRKRSSPFLVALTRS